MALQAFVTSVSGAGVIADLGTTDDAFIASGVTIASTDNAAIVATGSNHAITVFGTVVGFARGVLLGDDVAVDTGNHLYIAEGGYVGNYANGTVGIRVLSKAALVENEGTIAAKYDAITFGGDSEGGVSTLDNSGLIDAKRFAVVQQGSEKLVINNSGTIKGSFSDQSGAITEIINTGKYLGNIDLGGGADIFDTRKGTFTGTLNAGEGDDTVYGSAKADTVFGQIGNDKLYGNSGDDLLNGGSDDDYISGGNGKDQITGGSGRDQLRGGTGADKFIYVNAGDSTTATAGRDLILDFSQSQKDKIDLSLIDAKVGGGANDAFTFVGKSGFSGNEGELRYTNSGGDTKIYGDLDGDGSSDFSIWLDGTFTLKASDFVL